VNVCRCWSCSIPFKRSIKTLIQISSHQHTLLFVSHIHICSICDLIWQIINTLYMPTTLRGEGRRNYPQVSWKDASSIDCHAAFTKLPSVRLTLPSTKLCTKFKVFRIIFFSYYGYLWGPFKHFAKFEGHTSWGRHTNETLSLFMKFCSFKVIWTIFGGLFMALLCSSRWSEKKNVVKQIV
jgi:hypothetical protein